MNSSHPLYLSILVVLVSFIVSCECDCEEDAELPDLEVTDLTFTPSNPTTADAITFNATVLNSGDAAAGINDLTFRIGGEIEGEIFEVPELMHGETFTVGRSITLDVAQNYHNTITVDIENIIEESRENNNAATLHYAVTQGESYTVGVFYYPWHHENFHGGQYLRKRLVPPQLPELGEYDDREAAVIDQHLEWSRDAGIDLWVTSWWGPGSMEDGTLLDHILPHTNLGNLQIALFYETSGRTDNFSHYTNLDPDISYITENYFDHPNYLHIDGKPVLFIYLTRVMGYYGTLANSMSTIRAAATAAGYEIFIVGDHVFGGPPSTADELALLDAVCNYDVYGSMGATGYAAQFSVDRYYTEQAGWKYMAESVGTGFVPGTTPGFNDTAVRNGHGPLLRKLSDLAEFGSLFRAMVQGAKELVDPEMGNMLLVTSWNEWHEDTQIEPVVVAAATSTDDSPTGSDYTAGLEYEGYGTRYLDILSEEVKP